MLKSAIDKWLGGGSAVAEEQPSYDPRDLAGCMRHFEIGCNISYYPEARNDMKVESLILGYSINCNLVFSHKDIKVGEDALCLRDPEPLTIGLDEIEHFCYILPRQDRREIDWALREGESDAATSKCINDFARNALITISKNSDEGGVPTLDTVVRRSQLLREGPYINQAVSFLEPNVDSFTFIDRRQHCRIKCCIPVKLRCGKEKPLLDCVIHDFSERHLRIGPAADDNSLKKLYRGQHLVVVIELDGGHKRFVMNGTITRKLVGDVVVMLKGILHAEQFVEISPITELEIKSALINHPSSER